MVLVVKNSPAKAGDITMQVPSLRWEDFPGGGHGNPFPVSLPGESLERRRLVGHSPEGCKESDRTEVT